MARRRKMRGRELHGIILLDKPVGLSSNEALQEVKKIFHAQKAGHTGSLDPLASGLLPICFGEATKYSDYMLNSDKTYRTEMTLGVSTTTGDKEGQILHEAPIPQLKEEQLAETLASFLGESRQIPPMYSALKQDGQPLYKLARQGVEVNREARTIWIDFLNMTEFNVPTVKFDVKCSKGTYIRTLVEDMGKALGCPAHVSDLRRTTHGVFDINGAVTIDELNQLRQEKAFQALDNKILPIETALSELPSISLSEDSAFYVKQGQAVQVAKAPVDGWVSLFGANDMFMGIGEIQDDGKVKPKRMLKT